VVEGGWFAMDNYFIVADRGRVKFLAVRIDVSVMSFAEEMRV